MTIRSIFALALAAALAGLVLAHEGHNGPAAPVDGGTAAQGSISISGAWARASAGANGAAYATIASTGEADRLVSVASAVSSSVELHDMTMDGGVMKMRQVDGIDIPAGGSAELKPGGLHIMLISLNAPLAEGSTLTLTFKFEKAGAVEVTLPVKRS